jgi:hypothetical protein
VNARATSLPMELEAAESRLWDHLRCRRRDPSPPLQPSLPLELCVAASGLPSFRSALFFVKSFVMISSTHAHTETNDSYEARKVCKRKVPRNSRTP